VVHIRFFAGRCPCLAEVSDGLAVRVKDKLSKAIRAVLILDDALESLDSQLRRVLGVDE
jgi:hypothetical protein